MLESLWSLLIVFGLRIALEHDVQGRLLADDLEEPVVLASMMLVMMIAGRHGLLEALSIPDLILIEDARKRELSTRSFLCSSCNDKSCSALTIS